MEMEIGLPAGGGRIANGHIIIRVLSVGRVTVRPVVVAVNVGISGLGGH
jgi:hypothetical protein